MAFFKFRARGQKGDESALSPAETIDDMRRRARHRLIGSAVLVLIGVLGFPLLFDTQPRPVKVDIPIEIPDRDKTRPLGAGGKISAAEPAPAATAAASPAPTPAPAAATVAANASLADQEEVVADKPARVATPAPAPAPARPVVEAKAEHKPETKPEPKVVARVEPKVEHRVEAKTPVVNDDGLKARALLEGKPVVAEGQERFILQVGAFADAEKARETRARLERAGLKTYTQVVDTKDGKRIRVRVGPYAQRADAEKVASQIKSLSLPVSVIAL
jgi:DedD protein